jgi:hypothetical protein
MKNFSAQLIGFRPPDSAVFFERAGEVATWGPRLQHLVRCVRSTRAS